MFGLLADVGGRSGHYPAPRPSAATREAHGRGGHDGRFIWLEGVRELTGSSTAGTLLATTGIDSVESIDERPLPPEAEVMVDPWPRPVLLHGRAVLLAEECEGDNERSGWRILSKEAIRRY